MGALPRASCPGLEYVCAHVPAACVLGAVFMRLGTHLFIPLFTESYLWAGYGAECWERKGNHRHVVPSSWTHSPMGEGRYILIMHVYNDTRD